MNRSEAIVSNRLFLWSAVGSNALGMLIVSPFVKDIMTLQALLHVFMVLPCVIYLVYTKKSLTKTIGLNPIGFKQWVIVLLLCVCYDQIASFCNVFSQLFVENETAEFMLTLVENYPFVVTFLVIAVVPAISEELVYRGLVYQGYKKSSRMLAVVLSSVLFGLMHMNANQLSYAVILGVLFALVNEATGSILPSVIIHFFINAKSTVLLYGAVNMLRGFRAQYVAAELAGNTDRMAELVESMKGVPIDSENWLQEYLNMEINVKTELLSLLPLTVVAVAAVVILIPLMAKCSGRVSQWKDIKTNKKVSFLSPTLLVGCAICIAMMFT